ncbi:putative nuclease HARBI1 [Aphis gossypii]|uniref:putative nuclease HARBI1 n=1 Tax=Aphis gossypii TaxID=80765 RepID=UPI0021593156|nr:putative nuclease HARBI1 [Aphis gossypii]
MGAFVLDDFPITVLTLTIPNMNHSPWDKRYIVRNITLASRRTQIIRAQSLRRRTLSLYELSVLSRNSSIYEKFNVGRATALKWVRRVVNALDILAPAFIVWPNEERAKVIRNGFIGISNLPNVLSAIEGTHINIPTPHDHPKSYVNRKGHHSIQLQAVCDHQCKLIHCYAGNVGSVHDQQVFRLPELH